VTEVEKKNSIEIEIVLNRALDVPEIQTQIKSKITLSKITSIVINLNIVLQ
jgi:hypothetical protein